MKSIIEREKENNILKNLFKNCVFYISREVPVEIFGLAILSSGGIFGDESDNTSFSEGDPRITHFVVDRPPEFITTVENKEYVQPQWIIDCINNRKLLPISEYAPGKKLPPHLSPYYEYTQGEYRSKRELNINVEEKNTIEDKEAELKEIFISKIR